MRIRPATLADVPDIVEVHKGDVQAWTRGVGEKRREAAYEDLTLLERYMHGGPWMSVETCAVHVDSMHRLGHHPVVAEIGGRVVGEIEVFIGDERPLFDRTLVISVLYVHPDFQRQGVGSALMDHVLDLALDEGCDRASVNTDNDEYHRRFGFEHYLDLKQFTIETGSPALDHRVSHVGADYSLIQGMAMPVGRCVCSRLEWERDEMAQYGIPELEEGDLHRMRVDTPSAFAYVLQKQNPPWAQHLTALAWSDSMALEDILGIIRAEGARVRFARVEVLLHEDDFEWVKGTFGAAGVSSPACYVNWLRRANSARHRGGPERR